MAKAKRGGRTRKKIISEETKLGLGYIAFPVIVLTFIIIMLIIFPVR